MLASRQQTDALFCQGYHLTNPADAAASQLHNTCIAVCNGITDQRLTFAGGIAAVVDAGYDMLIVTARIWYGDSSQKVPRRVHLRMFATRRDDFLVDVGGAIDTNRVWLAYMSEHAHFDRPSQAVATTYEYTTTVEPWPEQYTTSQYFWQSDTNNDAAIGRWDNGASAADKYWQGAMLFDRRVDLKAIATQFFRIGLWKVVDAASGPSLRLLSIGVGALPGAGER